MVRWKNGFWLGLPLVFVGFGMASLWLYGGAPAEDAPLRVVQQVDRTVQAMGPRQTTLGLHLPESASFDFAQLSESPPPSSEALWASATLPDSQPRPPLLQNDETRELTIRWYRFEANAAVLQPGPGALGIESAVGGPVVVWGRSTGTGTPWQLLHDNRRVWLTQWNRPILVTLPTEWVNPGATFEVAVGLPTLAGINFGITPLRIGPESTLNWWHRKAMFWRTTVPLLISVCALLLGWFSVLLGRSVHAQKAFYLFGACTLVWAVRNLHYYISPPETRLAYEWFWWLTNASLSWVMVLSQIFIFRVGLLQWRTTERWLLAFATAISLITLPIWPVLTEALILQHLLNVGVAVLICVMTVWSAVRVKHTEFRWLAFAMLLGTVFGVHDWLMLSGRIAPGGVYLLSFVCLVIVVVFQNVLAKQHVRALLALGVANAEQQRLLDTQRMELDRQHQLLSVIASERAISEERKRLMRDMHDGLGASLLSSMAIVQSDPQVPEVLVQSISDCLIELRSVIDSLEPIEQDVGVLLGKLRHRIGPSLEAAGATMHWQVEELPALQWLNASRTLQLMRLLQEVFGNIIKHAKARNITVRAQMQGDAVAVEIKDDGVGFNVHAHCVGAGRGLSNVHTRAAALGSALELHTAQGEGVRWVLHLPLQEPQVASL